MKKLTIISVLTILTVSIFGVMSTSSLLAKESFFDFVKEKAFSVIYKPDGARQYGNPVTVSLEDKGFAILYNSIKFGDYYWQMYSKMWMKFYDPEGNKIDKIVFKKGAEGEHLYYADSILLPNGNIAVVWFNTKYVSDPNLPPDTHFYLYISLIDPINRQELKTTRIISPQEYHPIEANIFLVNDGVFVTWINQIGSANFVYTQKFNFDLEEITLPLQLNNTRWPENKRTVKLSGNNYLITYQSAEDRSGSIPDDIYFVELLEDGSFSSEQVLKIINSRRYKIDKTQDGFILVWQDEYTGKIFAQQFRKESNFVPYGETLELFSDGQAVLLGLHTLLDNSLAVLYSKSDYDTLYIKRFDLSGNKLDISKKVSSKRYPTQYLGSNDVTDLNSYGDFLIGYEVKDATGVGARIYRVTSSNK